MNRAAQTSTSPEFLHDGRYGHLPGVLDEEPAWILRKLIPLLSSKVIIDDYVVGRIRELAQRGPLVYAMKYPSIFDLHFLRLRLAKLGLPVPSYVLAASPSTGWSFSKWIKVWRNRFSGLLRDRRWPEEPDDEVLKEVFDHGGAAAFFLVDEETFRARYVHPERDPVRVLLDLQGRVSGGITVVPLVILYDRTQRRTIRPFWESFLGDPDQPGLLKRLLIATRRWTVPELLVGEPVYLVGEFEEFGANTTWDELPFSVRQELIDAVNTRIRVNRGPERMSRTEIKERVLQDARVLKAVSDTMVRESSTEEKVRKKAESYVDEMAGDQRIQVHHFVFYIVKWLLSKIFEGVDLRESDFQTLKKKNEQGSLIYVSCHKSHLDYLLIGFFSFVNQMAVPYMAAGKNLSFWPVGPILRYSGAFFIRRSFKGLGLYTKLYTQVFAAYLKVLVSEKININFYIEGGRSRTGKLLPPRTGMLAFLVQTVEEGAVADLTFVPTFIGYDQVPEEGSYLTELAGAEKQPETVGSLVRAREILKKSFGKVYVRFHEPVSFRDFCKQMGVDLQEGKPVLKEHRNLLNNFAYYLMTAIVRSGVVTGTELVAAGLMCRQRSRVSGSDLLDAVSVLLRALREEGIECTAGLEKPDTVVASTLGLFRVRGFVTLDDKSVAGPETVYLIHEQKRANLDFYRNSLVNYLWAPCFAAIALLNDELNAMEITPRIREDFQFLKELCSKELITDPLTSDDQLLERIWAFFRSQGWTPTARGSAAANRDALVCLRGLVADMLGVYHLVLEASEGVDDEGASQKDFARRMTEIGQKLPKEGEDRPLPMLASVTVANALSRFEEMGIFEYKPGRKGLSAVIDPHKRNSVRDFLARSLGWGH